MGNKLNLKTPIIIIPIISIVLLSIGGFYSVKQHPIFQPKSNTKQLTATPSIPNQQDIVPTTTPIQDTSLITVDWKTYMDYSFNYSFKYPQDWGVGELCENENRKGFVGIGPELLKFPGTNCGSANIPPTVAFYIDSSAPTPLPNYKVVEEKTFFIDGVKGQYKSFRIVDRTQAGSDNYLQFSIPLNNNYLIMETGSYPLRTNDFQMIISTLKLDI